MADKLNRLTDEQMAAVGPNEDVWLSASAGSGKTQVLSARVLRLLMQPGVRPENLLCLTFTKAAAAEMAERINKRLAHWVQCDNVALFNDLEAIDAPSGPEAKQNARKLFARVLSAPGGGLQIMTIHAFCQSLLASFPVEAGLLPGFEPIEGRAQEQLLREALAELVVAAENDGRGWVVDNLQALSLARGEAGAMQFLRRCASNRVALDSIADGPGALVATRYLVGLNFDGDVEAEIARRCEDSAVDRRLLETLAEQNRVWSKGKPEARGSQRADKIAQWLLLDGEGRAVALDLIWSCFAKSDGEPLVASKNYTPPNTAYENLALQAFQFFRELIELRCLADYAERLAGALLAGKAYAAQYAKAKHARGLVDFDDMIRRTADLLKAPGISEWVRYKLDRRIDHILVDEAQDTNESQWDIIRALAGDFHAGAGAKGEKRRTVFAVGDYKQAIYGFQGTDPEKYGEAHSEFARKIAESGGELRDLTLTRSFRSTQPVLQLVNALMEELGPSEIGLDTAVAAHQSRLADIGSIELFRPVSPKTSDLDDDEEGEESWLTEEKRRLAHLIAAHVRALIDERPVLAKTGKPLEPGDILILLRSRSSLAGLIVARLHAENVAVAGIDRLKISDPIVVQDLLAAVRFALQPNDDLSLACLLVSPLIGWNQDRLLARGYRRRGVHLWRHLRSQADLENELALLPSILAAADLATPFAFFENILSGPWRGRQRFAERLGSEAMVPIDEFLNLVLQYQKQGGTSLQGFLDWFEKGETEIKREGLAQSSEVRVMTVHGAKGLQAPVVILADATMDPEKSGGPVKAIDIQLDGDARLPLLPIRKAERIGRLAEAQDRHDMRALREHWRLLYVAVTRAEERLIIAGSLGSQSKGIAPEHSWYNALERAMRRLRCEWDAHPVWGEAMGHVGTDEAADSVTELAPVAAVNWPPPPWLLAAAPPEGSPPRPLAPSNLYADDFGDAPPPAIMRRAALRGKLIHALFEQYDGRHVVDYHRDAMAWLRRQSGVDGLDLADIADQACQILSAELWKPLFSASARAEVPLAALVGGQVITGRVDRLLVEDERVRVVDFKSGRKVPANVAEIPKPYLRQMAYYAAALEIIFPGKSVEASLLFTHDAKMLTLSAADLARHKPQ